MLELAFLLTTAATYHIGNSLTNDTVPQQIPDADYWIGCSVSLDFIIDNPDGFCIPSTPWPDALSANQYDAVSFQLHYQDTIASAIEDVTLLMSMQPESTRWVYHTGWPRLNDFDSPAAVHTDSFRAAVAAGLPQGVLSSYAHQALQFIAADSDSPYAGIGDLYRDQSHLTAGDGRYLAHQLMRRSSGVPLSVGWHLPLDQQSYLDGLLAANDWDWDGDRDGQDFLIWQRAGGTEPFNWGNGLVAIPETSSLALCCVGAFGLLRRVRSLAT